MVSRFSNGEYLVHILAYEDDLLRLLQKLQLHVAAGHALYAAVMLCRFTGQDSEARIEKGGFIAAMARPDRDHNAHTTSPADPTESLRGDLTLTLLQLDTTWRFDDLQNRAASPGLSESVIRNFFPAQHCVGRDLVLNDQFWHSNAPDIPSPPAHLLHIEISRSADSDAVVGETARKLRNSMQFWTRQLLFEVDPVDAESSRDSVKHVLLQEFDTRHTTESLAASVDVEALHRLHQQHTTKVSIRILDLVGSATYHNMTSRDPSDLVIDNRTHDGARDTSEPQTSYFGLSSKAYVDF